MPEILIQALIFVGTLVALVKSSDWFIGAAERLGFALGLPSFVIGVTVIATGTSLPELVSSMVAVKKGASEIVLGNVVGSNIANIGFVLGTVAILSKSFKIRHDIARADLPILFGSALLLVLTLLDGEFGITDAIVMLLGMVLFIAFNVLGSGHTVEEEDRPQFRPLDIVIVVATAVGIYFSARFNIESIQNLSELLGIGSEVIALTAVSLGTSLPELVVSIVAMRKGSHELVVGNVLGSNVFNTFAVMGIPAFFGKLVIPDIVLGFGLPMMMGLTFVFAFVTLDRKVNRWEGWLLFMLYGFFILETVRNAL